MVSKTSTKRNEKITKKGTERIAFRSSFRAIGASEAGKPKISPIPLGSSLIPMKKLTTVVSKIPMRIAPRTRRAMSTEMIRMPISVSSGPGWVRSPSATCVASSETMIPPLCSPI